jgi:TolA-binding protein
MSMPSWNIFKGPPPPPGPVDSLVLHGDRLEAEQPPAAKGGKTAGDMDGAKELFRRGDYGQAEKVFHRIANDTKNTTQLAEEARYYEAESLRLQGYYTKAADTYSRLLKDFYSGQYREQANQRLFDIANYWLDDTRAAMEASRKQKEGKQWLVWPSSYVHWEKAKPFLDEEGWALEKMEEIILDIRSPLADKALFYVGSVKFFRKEYREADQHFSQLVKMRPESPLVPQALKMAIVCKQLTTGGSDYDGRKTAEARELVQVAAHSYPELAKEKDFLNRQLYCINQQEADKDFKIAEFYRRTGHPGSAYFYYEIVRRRYPNTTYFDKATERMHELKAVLEKTPGKAPVVPAPAPPPRVPGPNGVETAPTPRPVVPGTPLVYPETAPAPRVLPPDMTGNR